MTLLKLLDSSKMYSLLWSNLWATEGDSIMKCFESHGVSTPLIERFRFMQKDSLSLHFPTTNKPGFPQHTLAQILCF